MKDTARLKSLAVHKTQTKPNRTNMIRKFTLTEDRRIAEWLAQEATALPGYMAALQIMTDMHVIARLMKVPDFILKRYEGGLMHRLLAKWQQHENQIIRDLLDRNRRLSFHISLEGGNMVLTIKFHSTRTVAYCDSIRIVLNCAQWDMSQIIDIQD